MHGSPTTLDDQVAELEGLLEERKKGSREAKLMLEASFSSAQAVVTELEEEKVAHSRDLKAFQKKHTGLDKQLLDLSDDKLEDIAFKNVVWHLELLVSDLWAFHVSFKFVSRIGSLYFVVSL